MEMTAKDVTPAVKSSVSAYLMARAYAETMRGKVDEIQRAILEECPLANGVEQEHGIEPKEITDPHRAWLCSDNDMMQDYYAESDKRLRAANLKPDDMPDAHCPALVAEHIQLKTEWLMLDCATEMLGMDFDGKELNNRLLCMSLEKRQEFINLLVKLVVNLPDFKNPLTH